eukprot:TRINITY_DN7204_c0_g1_i4.p4 TRINITY_DN7204_c0_g1~~TRINITY_DN7204_c0_g1_i4.p4  ORF type:complete len:124 (-),score=23.40 TRINITY_DN7204_c0_g1_i4:63-434(-)
MSLKQSITEKDESHQKKTGSCKLFLQLSERIYCPTNLTQKQVIKRGLQSALMNYYIPFLPDCNPKKWTQLEKNEAFECLQSLLADSIYNRTFKPVSYTHLTLPTICSVQISVVAVSLKKKKKE